ncbi:hypothetical protein AZE42_09043 [Rhizopogon vesiculosus]|uniref:Uncharacterized protein n=1 Tax=Rhizopogon vesiculosus TaxID=180088 RepID=A0A1J8QZY1_9AGAM|nr:hypothetical protein AZE42_09043 [Rhizopogon vesiculosus]
MSNRVFNGDSQIEVVTVIANCGADIAKARQALTTYIERKQEKGRSTDHILKKLRRLELKFISDNTLHSAFRDARAHTCLPRSPDLPLPDFVQRDIDMAKKRNSAPSNINITIPSPAGPSSGLPTSKSCVQLPSSPVQPAGSCIMDEIQTQPAGQASLTQFSLPPVNSSRVSVLSPYSLRSRSFTLPSSMQPLTHQRLRSSFNSPPPTSPLPDIPDEPTEDYDSHIPRLPPPDQRHISWGSQSSSSSHSSFLSPRTPGRGPPPYPGFSLRSAAIIRGNDYPPQREASITEQSSFVSDHDPSELSIPSMLFPSRKNSCVSETSDGDFPIAYRDSPTLRDRPAGRIFSLPLDNALSICGASLVVRREVSKCLQQDRGYEKYTWLTVLQECGIAEEDIPFLLNEMAREAESVSME